MNNRGNVIFILLLTIALLGALTYSVTRSSETVNENRDAETAYLAASDMIKYVSRIASGFERVRLVNRCDLSEISFDHPDRAHYEESGYYQNPNAREDGSCHVFDMSGGNAPYLVPPDAARFAGGSEYNIQNNLEIAGFSPVANQSDLMVVTFVNEDICFQVNRILGNDNPDGTPPDFSAAGSFSVPGAADETYPDFSADTSGFGSPVMEIGGADSGEAPELANKASGCFYASGALDKYVFYSLLAAR